MTMSHITSIAFALGLALSLATITGCTRAGATPTVAPPGASAAPAPRVTVARPVERDVSEWDDLTGWTEAVDAVEVRPRVSGLLESAHFEEGALVAQGDLLFVIDARPFQATLGRAAADVSRTAARVELAKSLLERSATLRATDAISKEEHDARQAALREASASLASTRAALETARLDVEFTRVLAPISGRIGRRLVTPGNLVTGGDGKATTLTTIVSIDPIHCFVDADERTTLRHRRRALEAERAGRVEPIPARLGLADEEGFPHEGRIDFLDNRLDPRTGTLRMRAVFANADRTLTPGLYARVRIPAGPPAPALLVPEPSLGSDQGKRFVLVVNADSVVERRPVEIGPLVNGERVIRRGLGKDDAVIVNSLMRAVPGAKVEAVLGPATAGGAQ